MSSAVYVYQRDASWSSSSRPSGGPATAWHRESDASPETAACSRLLVLLKDTKSTPAEVLLLCHKCFPKSAHPTDREPTQ